MSAKNLETDTELSIKGAAMKVFLAKGLAGARMQEIADEANINRAMLHYYYRSKEKLFEVVFSECMQEMHCRVNFIFNSGSSIQEKIRRFIESYYDDALEDPNFDMFLMNEFNQNPERMMHIMRQGNMMAEVEGFMRSVEQAVEAGEIAGNARQVILSLFSLCMFPFAGKTMLKNVMQLSETDYLELLRQRKEYLLDFVEKALKP